MSRQRIKMVITGMAMGGVWLLGSTPAFANHAEFPGRAQIYRTWMARAMDKCNPAAVSVVGANLPPGGCIQANTLTDETTTNPGGDVNGTKMKFARLSVRRFPGVAGGKGRVSLFGTGLRPSLRLKVQLTLRTTRHNINISHPARTKSITFQDTTMQCGNPANPGGCFIARPNGAIAASQNLTDCLTQNGIATGMATGNVQILDSALVNCDSGLVFATPGILN